MFNTAPYIDGKKVLVGGIVKPFEGVCDDKTSPIIDPKTGERTVIGRVAQMDENDVAEVLRSSCNAWDKGKGIWPQMSVEDRISALRTYIDRLSQCKNDIIHSLMWEIGKPTKDATSEFERTMDFMTKTIDEFLNLDENDGQWTNEEGYLVKTRRGPVGIMLNFGPFNYPLNESYCTLFPALLLGNIAIFKIPSLGGLAHILTMEAVASSLPPGVLNFISGSGRDLIEPLMNSGEIDILSFIGSSKVADVIIRAHPAPHRLRLFLQLESKNPAIVLPCADLETAAKEIAIGATKYNGQRCTSLKIVFIHTSIVEPMLERLCEQVASLSCGMPWVEGVQVTPLPELDKVQTLEALIEDAIHYGAMIVNADQGGGDKCHRSDNTMLPAILYPVTNQMKLWSIEQFGPMIPIVSYTSIDEVTEYISSGPYGQQASIFGQDSKNITPVLDILVNIVARVNLNMQCSRSPDMVPFTGRRSSGNGVMSVRDVLYEFSIPVVVAGKLQGSNEQILRGFDSNSTFLKPISSAHTKSSI